MDSPIAAWRTRVRVYECDALGHVNNAWYLAYLQQATAEAWPALHPEAWRLAQLSVEYLAPALAGDEIEVLAWPLGMDGDLALCGYHVRRAGDGKALVRALAGWATTPSMASPWPLEVPTGFTPPRPYRRTPDTLGAQSYRWRHAVRQYEVDTLGRAAPVEVLHWIEEAKYAACVQVGWSLERLLEHDTVIVQIRHDCELYASLGAGDEVEIVSRVYEMGRVKGTWRQELYRGGQLVGVDYAAGAFLSRAGRPSPPPREMLEALVGHALP